jgi:D-sedoheptulose 7-phosphate isomerase
MLESRIEQHFIDSADLKYQAAPVLSKPIAQAISAIVASLTSGGKVLACGNGGSAADAHISAPNSLAVLSGSAPNWRRLP